MGCDDTCVKYILFFFNLLFALFGLALLAAGIVYKLKLSYFTDLLDGKLDVQPVLFIIVGSIIFVVAFFGCCGAVRESNCMMVTYAILMIVIIIAQVIIAIVVFVYIGDIEQAISKLMRASFKNSTQDKEPDKGAWALMQKEFQCCGVINKSDYGGQILLPPSCCPGNLDYGCTLIQSYNVGCLETVSSFLKNGGHTVGGIAIGIAVVEVITVIFALCFANSIRNNDRRSRY